MQVGNEQMGRLLSAIAPLAALAFVLRAGRMQPVSGLVGHWKLMGDAKDYSGNGNDGTFHGVADTHELDGRAAYVEVSNSASLRLGAGDFSLAAWVHTKPELDGVFGDVVSKYDSTRRTGFTLSMTASASGYNSTSNTRHL